MRYAGGLVRHLGLQMYAGVVPAVAELVANAWDADATRVDIELPLDEPLADEAEIIVRDNGSGMTFEEVNDAYLVLGRDRRASTGTEYTANGRHVMGRKGIGKLAGFGIAKVVGVETVKDGHLTSFEMDYEAIVRGAGEELVEPYEPRLIADEDAEGREDGTAVRLTRLQTQRAINGDSFRRSMARRFAIFGDQFRVYVNGEELERQELQWQFRFPEQGWNDAEVEGLGPIKWWVGFTETPIPHEDARGLTVLARGKLVQAPFFFDLSGGAFGQHGMQYMAGEVTADGLDQERDLVATNRAAVMWEDPRAQPLLKWGESLVRDLLRRWAEGRQAENEERVRRLVPVLATLDRLPDRARSELSRAVKALASVDTIDEERLKELAEFMVKAYDNEHFMILVRELNEADDDVGEQLARVIAEWDVQEAVNLAWIVRGRIQIIERFKQMIDEGRPEKPDMQEFVKDHPWLLDPSWDVLRHETSLDRIIAEELGLEGETDEEGRRRLDFFTLADAGQAKVVELKRPGQALTKGDIRQTEDYVVALRNHYESITDPAEKRRVHGVLIGSELKAEDRDYFDSARQSGVVVTRTWSGLLESAERLHRDYLEVVRQRAPADDPRIEGIDDLGEEAGEQADGDRSAGAESSAGE